MKKPLVLFVSALLLALALVVSAMAADPPVVLLANDNATTPEDFMLGHNWTTETIQLAKGTNADYIATGLFDPGLAVVAVNDSFDQTVFSTTACVALPQPNATMTAAHAYDSIAALPRIRDQQPVAVIGSSWNQDMMQTGRMADKTVVGYYGETQADEPATGPGRVLKGVQCTE